MGWSNPFDWASPVFVDTVTHWVSMFAIPLLLVAGLIVAVSAAGGLRGVVSAFLLLGRRSRGGGGSASDGDDYTADMASSDLSAHYEDYAYDED